MKAPPSKSPATFTVRLIKSEPLDGNDDPGKTAVQPATEVEGNKSVSLSEDTAKIGLWSGTAGFFPHMYGTPSTSNHSFGVALATLRKTVDQLPGSEKPTNMYYTQPSRTAPKGPTEERPYACEQCQAAFTQAVYLKKHLKTHSGIKPWKCEQCGKTFIRRSQLSVHARSHSGEKPYKCSHCDATFAQSGHLQVHTRTHTGEKLTPSYFQQNDVQNEVRFPLHPSIVHKHLEYRSCCHLILSLFLLCAYKIVAAFGRYIHKTTPELCVI